MKQQYLLAAFVALSWSLFACGDDVQSGDDIDNKPCEGGECHIEPVCEGDECDVELEPDPCDGVECESWQVCEAGSCIGEKPEGTSCESIVCSESTECILGECQPIVIACGDVFCDVSKNEACISEHCEVIDVSDEDSCGEDEYFSEGTCVQLPPDGEVEFGDEEVIEPVAGHMEVSPTSGLKTYRGGRTAEFGVSLDVRPSDTVVIPIKSLNKDLGTVSPTKLKFTPDNWEDVQVVTITGTTSATVDKQKYQIQVGPLNTSDAAFKDVSKVLVDVTHVDDLKGKGSCGSGKSPDDSGECITTPVKKISFGYSSYALRRKEERTLKVKFEPEDASNQNLIVTLYNETSGKTLSSSGSVIRWTTDGPSITLIEKAKNAQKVKLTVTSESNSKLKAETYIYVKPYTKPSYDTVKTLRNFNFKCKNKSEANYSTSCEPDLGDLSCEVYTAYSVEVFNKDLFNKYVKPNLMPVKQEDGTTKYYGTRASVVAAARFLTVQFPYDIPYYMEKKRANRLTNSDYIWISSEKRKAPEKARIYGLNLSKTAYGRDKADENYVVLTKKNSAGEYVNADNIASWACPITNSNGYKNLNGMACSSFVTWAFRNGRFHIGAWTSSQINDYLFPGDLEGLESYLNSKNKNNAYDEAYEKLKLIRRSDFLEMSKMDGTEDIKAGDLVWHTKDSKTGFAHIAMILGLKRDANGKIKSIYVGEATSAGNHVEQYTSWSSFKSDTHWTNAERGRVGYVIKMDYVYNYYSQKDSKGNYLKDSDGNKLDANSWNYTAFWK